MYENCGIYSEYFFDDPATPSWARSWLHVTPLHHWLCVHLNRNEVPRPDRICTKSCWLCSLSAESPPGLNDRRRRCDSIHSCRFVFGRSVDYWHFVYPTLLIEWEPHFSLYRVYYFVTSFYFYCRFVTCECINASKIWFNVLLVSFSSIWNHKKSFDF